MKKIIKNALLISLSIVLFSCVNLNVNIVETMPEETKALEEKVADIMSLGENLSGENNKILVSTEKVKIEAKEDGKLYCEASYDKFNMTDVFAFKYQALNAELLDFNKKSENAAKEFIEQFGNEAKEMMKERNDDTLVLSSDSSVNIIRNDDKIFSFTNEVYSFTGGAHGNFGTVCYNYDTKSGMLLKNKDVFADMDLLYERLINELRKQDEANKDAMLLFEEYPKTIKDMIDQNEELSMILYSDAVEILFDPYLIGPWSSSTITVKFNYKDNKDLLNNSRIESLNPNDIAGTYVRHYQEEIEGENIDKVDKITLRSDMSCTIDFQDTIDGTWDTDGNIVCGGAKDTFNISGKKLILKRGDDGLVLEFTKE